MRGSHVRVRVVYMQRVVSMSEPLAGRQSSEGGVLWRRGPLEAGSPGGGVLCMQGAIRLWAVTMFWVAVSKPRLSLGNACKMDRR